MIEIVESHNEEVFKLGKNFINAVKFNGSSLKHSRSFTNNFEKLILLINKDIINPLTDKLIIANDEIKRNKELSLRISNENSQLSDEVSRLSKIVDAISVSSIEPDIKKPFTTKDNIFSEFDINMY